jgi:uncharacterized NAD(P)/FAD-binding protein YdhS
MTVTVRTATVNVEQMGAQVISIHACAIIIAAAAVGLLISAAVVMATTHYWHIGMALVVTAAAVGTLAGMAEAWDAHTRRQ